MIENLFRNLFLVELFLEIPGHQPKERLLGRYIMIQDVVDFTGDRHFHFQFPGKVVHGFGCFHPFRHHAHF